MEDTSVLVMNGYHKPHHRVLKPPGGETHDIFGTGNSDAYNEATEASRRARSVNHQNQLQSRIFDPIPYTNGNSKTNGSANGNGTCQKQEEEDKIVGEAEELEEISLNGDEADGAKKDVEEQQPRRIVKDHMKSTVFGDWYEGGQNTPRRQSAGYGGGNPITGEGYANGQLPNGDQNESPNNRRGRFPPGGPTSNLW
ncbi:hypothetical protein CHUAL_011684 [Chamberlinius hualienensis]